MMEPQARPLGGIITHDEDDASERAGHLHAGDGFVDRYFQITSRGSSQRREIVAGVTTRMRGNDRGLRHVPLSGAGRPLG